MSKRRLMVLAALAVAEIWTMSAIVRSVSAGFGSQAGAAEAAANAWSFATGATPTVVIDAEASTVHVMTRPGSSVQVHVTRSGKGGVLTRLAVERTADGVRIYERSGIVINFGNIHRTIAVETPPGTRLDVRNAAQLSASGLRAAARVHVENGSVTIGDHRAALDASSENGKVELRRVDGPSITAHTENGRIDLSDVRVPSLRLSTANGPVVLHSAIVRDGDIHTDNGAIDAALDPRSDTTVSAHTENGRVVLAESAQTIGAGAGRLTMTTQNGAIAVRTTDGETPR